MSIVIITGSNGLVGSEAVNFFSKKGFKVLGIDNNLRKFFFGSDGSTSWLKKKIIKENSKYKHFNADIRNYQSLEKIFKTYRNNISLIIHCAAQPSHDYGKNFPKIDFDVNASGTLNLLELTRKFCPKSPFIFMSTNKVYGDNPNKLKLIEKKTRYEPVNKIYIKNGIGENFNIDHSIHSFFGVSKVYADLVAQEFGKNYGLKIGIFRAGCLTGPNHSGAGLHGFLSFLVKSCFLSRKYNIIGYKGKQVRDNLHSNDLLNAFWEYIKKPKAGEVYNIGGGKYSNCSIIEAVNIVQKKVNSKIKLKYLKKNRVGDHIWYISDLSKFMKDYPNWSISYNTNSIINEIIDKYK